MACPLCGDRCTCSATGGDFAGEHTAVLIDPDSNYSSDVSEQQFASSLGANAPLRPGPSSRVAVGQAATAKADPAFYRPPDDSAWRDEISQRVQAHKARRRRRFDSEASLTFGFEPETTVESDEATSVNAEAQESADASEQSVTPERAMPPRMYRRIALEEAQTAYAEVDTNLIEFPRAITQDMFADELAEPIMETPRILDVPEEPMVPLPASEASASLSSLRLDEHVNPNFSPGFNQGFDPDSDQDQEVPEWIRNYRDPYDEAELELPLQVAPLRPRVVSAVIDSALVLTATAVFCVIVLSITKFMPQGRAAVLAAVGLSAAFWLAYHYTFLVFGGVTPGMQVAQLELCSFEGCYPLRRTRGARAWAMGVSCMSLGMGFAWAMVDEDGLGWHDRITRTYLRQS